MFITLVSQDGQNVFYDSPRQVLSELIADYDIDGGVDEKAAYALRHRFAKQVVEALQANSIDSYEVAIYPDDVRRALSVRGTGVVAQWGHDIPLYVIATFYAPYSDIPLPEGNVIAIDPSTEMNLVSSLLDAGVLQSKQE
ncbi:hypothetical protein [Actinomyces vulturis]|uniref:hypothetical protein n=1 Tax=Actinomyces vulturis TaxID=1857645 RepID=UPI000829621A|nr:hypothetical protein [Actinomyces vulturis]